MENFLDQLIPIATTLAMRLLSAIVVFVVGHFLIKLVMRLLKKSKFAQKTDKTVINVSFNFIKAVMYIILLVSIIGILGVPMASVIAVIASAGVAIGLALQGALSNVAGGLMILFVRPFHIGDFVDISDFSGTVEDIGIIYTKLVTPDNKVITIPNGTVMGGIITDYSKKDTRRVDLNFSVAHDMDADRIKHILLEEAGKHELVLEDPAPFCRMTKRTENALEMVLRVWTKQADYWQVNFDLLESINARFVKEGILIPHNQVDVHICKKDD